MKQDGAIPGSFRDPAGVVYRRDGVLYRQLNVAARAAWEPLEASGFLASLMDAGLLVRHEDVDLALALDDRAFKVIQPEPVPFISFPYEWSVRQLVDAALLTLELQRRAIEQGFTLRDASAYNVQLVRGRPVFIDTLSFGPWVEGEAWVAYGQFCRHFAAPLALYHWFGPSMRGLLRANIDGIPLPLVSKMLPTTSWLRPGVLSHIHLHARATTQYADAAGEGGSTKVAAAKVGRTGMLGLIDSLRGMIEGFDVRPAGTEWGDYYAATNYSDTAAASKAALIQRGIQALSDGADAPTVWDLGANTGRYSRVAAESGASVVAFDIDEAAVDKHWRAISAADPRPDILPLVQDLTNPSPSLGWAHTERPSVTARGPADVIMALALIHHLAISNNTPLDRIAAWFASLGRGALVEMVPKDDSQVKRLLATREDIFPAYTPAGFEEAFSVYFDIVDRYPVVDSTRILYVLRRKDP